MRMTDRGWKRNPGSLVRDPVPLTYLDLTFKYL